MAFWVKKLAGKIGGEDDDSNDDAERAAEEARRKAEEEAREAEERRRREEEAKARAERAEEQRREREEAARQAEEERQESIESAAEAPDVPVIELEEQRIDVPGVSIPEDEIEVTPAPDPAPPMNADVPDRALQPPSPTPLPQPEPLPPARAARVADLGIALGSQQSMADQGYEPQPAPVSAAEQRRVLADMARAEGAVSETGAALDSPPTPAAQPPAPQPARAPAPPTQPAPQPQAEQPDPGLEQLQAAADRTGRQGEAREDELAKAQRRDRILKAIRGLLGLGGIIGGTVGAMRGNPNAQLAGAAISGLGRFAGSLGGYGDDTRRRQAGARADERTAAGQQQAALRARQYDRQLGQTEEAQRQRMTLAQQNRADRLRAQEREAAMAAEALPLEREVARARLEAQRTRTAAQQQDMELAAERNARAERLADAQVQSMTRRGRGGGRRRSAEPAPVTDTVRRRVAEEFPLAPPEERERIEQQVMAEEGLAGAVMSTDARQQSRERREQQARSSLPGFRLKEGEAPPDDTSWRSLRDALTAYRDARRQLSQMTAALERAGVGDALWSNVQNTEDSAQYAINRNAVMSALQKMSGGGVLTDGDVERLSALVPSYGMGSVRNGEAALRAMLSDMQATVRNRMDVYGYEAGGGGTVRRRLTPEQAERVRRMREAR